MGQWISGVCLENKLFHNWCILKLYLIKYNAFSSLIYYVYVSSCRSNVVVKPTEYPKPSWTPKPTKRPTPSWTPPTTTKRTTTRKTTTTTEKSFEIEAIVAESGELTGQSCRFGQQPARNDRDCAKYYICVHDEWVPKKCADRLLFDTAKNRCNWGHIVNCGSRKSKRCAIM